MKKILLAVSLLIFTLFCLAKPSVAAVRCETQYGGNEVCVTTGQLQINKEVFNDEVIKDLDLTRNELEEVRAIEVGNIFNLGTKFSEPFGLKVLDKQGKSVELIMGCYGIGISRVMGTIAELLSDDKGLIWPEAVAPFKIYLARLGDAQDTVRAAEKTYNELTEAGVKVLYDDRRDASAGEMFADADLMGLPLRLVVSQKSLQEGSAELKNRTSESTQLIRLDKLVETIANNQ